MPVRYLRKSTDTSHDKERPVENDVIQGKELKTEIDQLRKDLDVLRMKGTSRGGRAT